MRALLFQVLFFSLLSAGLFSSSLSVGTPQPQTTKPGPIPIPVFEEPGALPSGWRVPAAMAALGFHARIDRDPSIRSLVLHLSSPPSAQYSLPGTRAPKSSRSRIGSVLYSFDANAYEGRNLHFQTRARLVPPGGEARYPESGVVHDRRRATAWMRFDRSTGPPLFFEQAEIDAHLGWQTIHIDAAVPVGTKQIHLGLTLYEDGDAWLADVRLKDTGPSGHEPARALTDLGRENLVVLTQLYGVIRYFHPSDESAGTNWDHFLFDAIARIESAVDEGGRVRELEALFIGIAPTLTLAGGVPNYGEGDPPDHVLIWDHYGVGAGRDGAYVSERRPDETLSSEGYPRPLKSVAVDLGPNTRAHVPLAVYANAAGTLPRTGRRSTSPVTPRDESTGFLPSYHDRTTRLAAVIVLWNVVEHFFPYFDESDCDWSAHLRPLLQAAANLDDRDEFLAALQTAVADLDDGHADVYPFYDLKTGRLPLTWQSLDDAVIVTNSALKMIHRGDRIVTINHVPVDEYLAELETRISSPTRRWKRQRALDRAREGSIGHQIHLTFERHDRTRADATVEYWSQGRVRSWISRTTLPTFHRWTDGMIYIDTSRATDAQMRDWIPQLSAARGVILDMRGYPKRLSTRFLEHIVDHPTRSLQWHVPVTRAPHRTETYVSSSNWTIRPRSPHVSSPIALLQDERAISRTETYLALFKESGVGQIFGSATAGTNGNSNAVILPGDFRLTFTGMEVRQPDGKRFHGVGVAPDVLVRPSRENIRAGRDEVLESARSWIRTMRPGPGKKAARP